MPSAAWRPMRTIGWIVVPVRRVVEDALEQPPGVAGARRALGQRHALGHLDDAERRQLAGPRVEHAPRRAGSAPRPSSGWRPG